MVMMGDTDEGSFSGIQLLIQCWAEQSQRMMVVVVGGCMMGG